MPTEYSPFHSPSLTKDRVFERVTVSMQVQGSAVVEWSLSRNFTEPEPRTYQLQFSYSGIEDGDDWEDVGDPEDNVFTLTDDTSRRVGGKEWNPTYRVKLTTDDGVHYSEPVQVYGVLTPDDWRIAAELVRIHKLRLELTDGWSGWILRKRFAGTTPDPTDAIERITSPITGNLQTSYATGYAGTAFLSGYFEPVRFYVDISRGKRGAKFGSTESRNVGDPQSRHGVALAFPRVQTQDVFVHAGSDRRFELHEIEGVVEQRGTPLLVSFEMRLLPAGDPVYGVSVG